MLTGPLGFGPFLVIKRSPSCSTPLRRASLGGHKTSSVIIFSLRTSAWLGAAVVVAGLGTAGCTSSSTTTPAASPSAAPKVLTVHQLVFGELLQNATP